MRFFLFTIASFFTLTAFGQYKFLADTVLPSDGFTNKAEAKNEVRDSLKEGKWVEYFSVEDYMQTDDTNAPYYRLTIYKKSQVIGIRREYYRSGKLYWQCKYSNGKINGIKKWYYENGKLMLIKSYINDEENGVEKYYYKNGGMGYERHYTKGKENGLERDYYENGKLMSETIYTNGQGTVLKNYDTNGNEIKSK